MFWRRMNLDKTRELREKIHKFTMREHELDKSLNRLTGVLEKLFSDKKEMDDAKTAAKHAKTKKEYSDQVKRFNVAKRSESHNEKYFRRALSLFKEKWNKLKRSI